MCTSYMSSKFTCSFKTKITLLTLEGFFSSVYPLMYLKLISVLKGFVTILTNIWLTFFMDEFVEPQ